MQKFEPIAIIFDVKDKYAERLVLELVTRTRLPFKLNPKVGTYPLVFYLQCYSSGSYAPLTDKIIYNEAENRLVKNGRLIVLAFEHARQFYENNLLKQEKLKRGADGRIIIEYTEWFRPHDIVQFVWFDKEKELMHDQDQFKINNTGVKTLQNLFNHPM